MFQQQNAFFTGALSEVDSAALRALAVLATTDGRNGATRSSHEVKEKAYLYCALMDQFYEAAISPEQGRIARVIQDIQQAGIGNQDVTSTFVPAVARQLGTAWEQDLLAFSTVTIASARLQAIVRHLDQGMVLEQETLPETRQSCLIVVPEGTQHTLGAIVMTSQLRHAGARVKLALGVCNETMARMVDAAHYDAVMISGADARRLDDLCSLVKSARKARSSSKIILGGCILGQCADLVSATKSVYVSHDWQEALDLCASDCRVS